MQKHRGVKELEKLGEQIFGNFTAEFVGKLEEMSLLDDTRS